MSDIFLSHARPDDEIAGTLADTLRARGWSVWLDSNLRPGDYWDDQIAVELEAAKCVIVLWSQASVQSHWVKSEAEHARKRGILTPVRLDAVSLPFGFALLHTADLSDWHGDEHHRGLNELIAGVVRVLDKPPKVTSSRVDRGRSRLWSLAAFAALPGGAFLFLSLVHRDWTAVGLDVKATGTSFTAQEATLSGLLVVSQIAAAGVQRLEMPRTKVTSAMDLGPKAPGILRLSTEEASGNGSITLAPVSLPAGSRASVFAGEREGEFRIRMDRNEPLTINVAGTVSVAVTGQPPQSMDFGFPKPLVLRAGENGTDIAFRVTALTGNVAPAPIPVTSLAFIKVEEQVARDRINIREVSTVTSGTLRTGSTGQTLTLAKGDRLLLEESAGTITGLQLSGDRLGVQFDGKARRVAACTGEVCQDLSVTVAGWLWDQHRVATLTSVSAYLALAGLFAWIRTRS